MSKYFTNGNILFFSDNIRLRKYNLLLLTPGLLAIEGWAGVRRVSMVLLLLISYSLSSQGQTTTYTVVRSKEKLTIDGNWDKPAWKAVKPLVIKDRMGAQPKFTPTAEAKVMYDSANIYVIFKVQDRFVRSVVTEYNGDVSNDACVEFFFSPDTKKPLHYFNLEVNAGGTPLMFFVTKPWSEFKKMTPSVISQIEIAHSLPKVVDPEITGDVTWTIEYRIPLQILKANSTLTTPAPGVTWRANFYKTASTTSNQHYLTWSHVEHPQPNFHLPEYFGKLVFQ